MVRKILILIIDYFTPAQKMKFSVKDFSVNLTKSADILKKSLMENFVFCVVTSAHLIRAKVRPLSNNNWSKTFSLLLSCIHINAAVFKVGLLPSKKVGFICFNGRPFKMMENAFYFILKALFLVKIFKFLSKRFWSCRKTSW